MRPLSNDSHLLLALLAARCLPAALIMTLGLLGPAPHACAVLTCHRAWLCSWHTRLPLGFHGLSLFRMWPFYFSVPWATLSWVSGTQVARDSSRDWIGGSLTVSQWPHQSPRPLSLSHDPIMLWTQGQLMLVFQEAYWARGGRWGHGSLAVRDLPTAPTTLWAQWSWAEGLDLSQVPSSPAGRGTVTDSPPGSH